MPLRALAQDDLLEERHTGGKTTTAINGYTVAIPRECYYTIFIETAQLDERRDLDECFSAV